MPLHTKYRPSSLDKLIGHTDIVTRLKGIINSGNVPSAMLFTGPTSVGKTTLARAFACDLSGMGKDFLHCQDFVERNFSDQRGIDDIRQLEQLTRYKPQMSKYRVIIGDECQGLLSNNAAANCALKLIEESKNTVWILCSMNPEKFKTTTLGKAIANRCVQFNLEPHTNGDLLKQAKRICKYEKMDYMIDDEYSLLKTVVKNSNNEMRTLAQLLEACQQYYNGLETKPDTLSKENISSILSTVESSEEKLASQFICAIYGRQFTNAQKAILDSNDHVGLLTRVMYINSFLLNNTILNGQRHPKVWATNTNKQVLAYVSKLKTKLVHLADVNTRLVECKAKAMAFTVGTDALLSAFAYSAIKSLQAIDKGE